MRCGSSTTCDKTKAFWPAFRVAKLHETQLQASSHIAWLRSQVLLYSTTNNIVLLYSTTNKRAKMCQTPRALAAALSSRRCHVRC